MKQKAVRERLKAFICIVISDLPVVSIEEDIISPTLFNACLKVLKHPNWAETGISAYGKYLASLRFVDDTNGDCG